MSFIAKLHLDGEEMNVLQCSFRFTEATDATGMPTSIPRGGFIKLVVESDSSSSLFDWMISNLETKSGYVIFFRRDALSTLKKLEFTDAYCVEYYETFNHNGDDPLQIQLKISAGKLTLNESEYSGEGESANQPVKEQPLRKTKDKSKDRFSKEVAELSIVEEPIPDSNIIIIDDPDKLDVKAQKDSLTHYNFTEKDSGAIWGMLDLEEDAPNTYLFPHESQLGGKTVNLQAIGFSWTLKAIQLMIETHKVVYGRPPKTLPGSLAEKNKLNFQKEYVKIREAQPQLSSAEVANLAIRKISFGKHRIESGYGNIQVEATNFKTVTIGDVVYEDVPTSIQVIASPSST